MILSYFSLIAAILCTAVGQFFYKKFSLTKNRKYYLLTMTLFLLTPVFSFIALQNIPIDIVYIFTSLTILIVLILSGLFLKEKIMPRVYIGVFFILIGVIIYGI